MLKKEDRWEKCCTGWQQWVSIDKFDLGGWLDLESLFGLQSVLSTTADALLKSDW